MLRKTELKKEIQECKNQIVLLENKRSRSQAALVDALLNHKEPNDADVDYFNMFTEQITEVREKMHALMAELDAMSL